MTHARSTNLRALIALRSFLLLSAVTLISLLLLSPVAVEQLAPASGQAGAEAPGGTTVFGDAIAPSGPVDSSIVPVISLPSNVQVPTDIVYYQVAGSTLEALRDQVRQNGPGDASGHWTASTRWTFGWTYPYAPTVAGCSSGPVQVKVSVTFTYPKWIPPGDAPTALVDRWNRYLDAVALHENGHREIAADGGRQLAQALESLPPSPTCEVFNQAAAGVVGEVVSRYNQLQVNYDRVTAHGVNQGAVFQ